MGYFAAGAICLALLLQCQLAATATLYASLEGNDGTGDGTALKPFLSVSKAIQTAASSDDIVLTCQASHCEFPVVGSPGLQLTKSLNIKADTAKAVVLDAKMANRVLTIQGSAAVSIENVHLMRGQAASGGALAVLNSASVTLKSCTVSQSVATGMASAEGGGAIWTSDTASITLNACTIRDNIAGGNGGAALLTSAMAATFANTNFVNNSVLVPTSQFTRFAHGGAVHATGPCEFTSCAFQSNRAGSVLGSYGGAVSLLATNASNIHMKHCQFDDNSGLYGGAVAVLSASSKVTVEDTSFTANRGEDVVMTDPIPSEGAALYAKYASPSFTRCNFTRHAGSQYGGVIRAINSAEPAFVMSNFTANNVNDRTSSGGVVYATLSAKPSFTTCHFYGNGGMKGAVGRTKYGGGLSATGCTFTNNTAVESGGVFAVASACVGCFVVKASHFSSNTAVSSVGGGVVYSDVSAMPLFESCVFEKNTAPKGPGGVGIFYTPARPHFVSCKMSENTAYQSGGALSIRGTSGLVSGTHFSKNTVTKKSDSGGSVYLGVNSTTSFEKCRFSDHSGRKGTAVSLVSASPSFVSTVFDNNRAQSGAIYTSQASNPKFIHCEFSNNKAVRIDALEYGGAALFLADMGSPVVDHSTFDSNAGQTGYGGAIWVGTDTKLQVSSSNFIRNSAVRGGAISIRSIAVTKFANNSFSLNKAEQGGAVHVDEAAAASFVTNCKFMSNTGNDGGALFTAKAATVGIDDASFTTNVAAGFGGAIQFGPLLRVLKNTTRPIANLRFYTNQAANAGGAVYWSDTTPPTPCSSCLFESNVAKEYGNDQASDIHTVGVASYTQTSVQPGVAMNVPGIVAELRDFFNQKTTSTVNGYGVRCGFLQSDKLWLTSGSNTSFTANGSAVFRGLKFAGAIGTTYPMALSCSWSRCIGDSVFNYMKTANTTLSIASCHLGEKAVMYSPGIDLSAGSNGAVKDKKNRGKKGMAGRRTGDVALPVATIFPAAATNEYAMQCEVCPANTFSVVQHATECKFCPKGAICNGGYHMESTAGYWHYKQLSDDVYICPFEGACPGNLTAQCDTGYEGVACGICADGYTRSGGKCVSCSGSGNSTLTLYSPGLAFLAVAVLVMLFWCVSRPSVEVSDDLPTLSIEERSMMKMKLEIQAAADSAAASGTGTGVGIEMTTMDDKGENEEYEKFKRAAFEEAMDMDDYIANKSMSEEDLRALNPLRKFQGMLKIIISYIQIIALLQVAVPSVPWPSHFTNLSSFFTFAVLDVVEFIPLGCLGIPPTYYTKFCMACVSLPLLCLGVYLPLWRQTVAMKQEYETAIKLGRTITTEKAKELYENAYNAQLKGPLFVVFMLYPAVSLSILSVFNCRYIEGSWYMVEDLGVQCYEGSWVGLSTAASVMTFVYPLGIPFAVYVVLQRNSHKLYREKFWHRAGFLYENYTSEHILQDVYEMVRKLLMTSIMMFFMPGTNMQIGLAMLMAYGYMVSHIGHHPFFDECQNDLQTLNLAGIVGTLFCGAMLKSFDCKPDMTSPWDVWFFEWAMILLNVAIFVYMIYKTIVEGLLSVAVDYVTDVVEKSETRKKRLNALTNASLMIEVEPEKAPEKKVKVVREERIPKITAGVDITEVLQAVDLDAVAKQLLSSPELLQIAQQGGMLGEPLTDDEAKATISNIRTSLMWYLDEFESQREALLRCTAQAAEDAVWPPETMTGLRKAHEVMPMAYEHAGEADLAPSIEKAVLAEMCDIATPKFPEYCDEVVQIKTYFRKVARTIAKAVMQNGVGTFKSGIDRILKSVKQKLTAGMEPGFYTTAQDVFDRVSADGRTLCTGEEFRNVVTALEYKFNEYLSMPVDKAQVLDATADAVEKEALSFMDFLDWFNHTYRAETFNREFYIKLRGSEPDTSMATFGKPTHPGRLSSRTSESEDTTLNPSTNATTVNGSSAYTTTSGGTRKAKSKIALARKNLGAAIKKSKKGAEASAELSADV